MARALVFRHGEEVSRFGLSRHSREKLYGTRKRVVVDDAGRECERGLLSDDGELLLPPGAVAMMYLDPAFDVVERAELRAVGEDGVPIERVPSTLDREVPLTGPVPLSEVLDHVTPVAYALEAEALGPSLRDALARGEIFRGVFAYTEGFELQDLFLLQNDEGVWALVGRPTGFTWTRLDSPPAPEEDDVLFEDDLDFGMM